MSELPIQIVNKYDEPIGSASKHEAWTKGLIHRVVRVSIVDENNQLLVQKRSSTKELYPGRWDNSAAGHVDTSESYDFAMSRELKEELGLENLPFEVLGNYYVEVQNEWRIMRRFTRAYLIQLQDPIPDFQLTNDEVEGVEWMEIDTVKNLVSRQPDMVTDGLEQIVNRFL